MMKYLNSKKNNRNLITAATIFVIATITASIMATPVVATSMTTTTTSSSAAAEAAGLELSPQPVLRERQINESQTPINGTHVLFTDVGNGTITLPNTTEAINFTGIDNVVVSILDGTAVGQEVFTTLEGNETVNGKVYAISRFNMEEGTGKGVAILLLQTNSTGRLAPLDGMIVAGHIEFYPDGSAESTVWEWESGVPLPTTTSITTEGSPSPMNTTTMTTMTNTTTTTTTAAADANTNVTTALSQEEEGGEQQQQQTTTLAPNPLFE